MDLGLKGKRAIVTAASRGLGLATAQSLANEGVHVTMNARSEGPLIEAAEKIRSQDAKEGPGRLGGDMGFERLGVGRVKAFGEWIELEIEALAQDHHHHRDQKAHKEAAHFPTHVHAPWWACSRMD